jgi:Oxysterol-binding protein
MGSALFSGQSIMNVSLPINIFDDRSLLETFAFQYSLSPYFLDKAGLESNQLEKLKLVTTFAISMLHQSVTQLKPFNPIWGETFQAKIGNSNFYFEQSSHHPPIYHFLVFNYKVVCR